MGLVAVVKGPSIDTGSGPSVFLEMYYKYGEWDVSTWGSEYFDDAMDEIEQEMGEEEWEDMSELHKEDMALERCQENVNNQQGWGAVLKIPGRLVGKAPNRLHP
jgi:hypothetical protein